MKTKNKIRMFKIVAKRFVTAVCCSLSILLRLLQYFTSTLGCCLKVLLERLYSIYLFSYLLTLFRDQVLQRNYQNSFHYKKYLRIFANNKSTLTCISAVSTHTQSVATIAIANRKRSNQKC